jgi:pyrroloquinoline quinone biosynthesis protein D
VSVPPRLSAGVRLHWDRAREQHVLLYPEGMLKLNDTAVAVLELCDGERSLDDIASTLSQKYGGANVTPDVDTLLNSLAQRGLVDYGDA